MQGRTMMIIASTQLMQGYHRSGEVWIQVWRKIIRTEFSTIFPRCFDPVGGELGGEISKSSNGELVEGFGDRHFLFSLLCIARAMHPGVRWIYPEGDTLFGVLDERVVAIVLDLETWRRKILNYAYGSEGVNICLTGANQADDGAIDLNAVSRYPSELRSVNKSDRRQPPPSAKPLFQALVSYERRGEAKAAGFMWRRDMRRWVRRMTEDEARRLPFPVKRIDKEEVDP